jgi:hypothetical protein
MFQPPDRCCFCTLCALTTSCSLGFSQPTIFLQARCLPVHINVEVRVQLSRLRHWMFLCADCESDRKTWQLVSNCTILPSNTSTCRQITEHADFRKYNGQVRCRIICSSFLISHLYLHNRSNRTFINGQPSLESGPHELKSDGMFVCISSHCIPYSHLLTGIRHQRCMRRFIRFYRHTAATTASTTPARLNSPLVVHNCPPLPGHNTPLLGCS